MKRAVLEMTKPVADCAWGANAAWVLLFMVYLIVADGWFWKCICILGIFDNVYFGCKKKGLCT